MVAPSTSSRAALTSARKDKSVTGKVYRPEEETAVRSFP